MVHKFNFTSEEVLVILDSLKMMVKDAEINPEDRGTAEEVLCIMLDSVMDDLKGGAVID